MGGRGSGGHNKKDAEVKKRQGNAGHRNLNKRAPKGAPGTPEMPLGLSAVAEQEWNSIVPILHRMGVQLCEGDGKSLAAYCSCYAQWMLAEKEIALYGITINVVHTDADDPDEILFSEFKVNPAVRVRSDALRQMKSFLIEFGLTPASRNKLETKPAGSDKPDDPLEDFLSGKTSRETVN